MINRKEKKGTVVQFRQGDVFLIASNKPKGAVKQPKNESRVVLEYGEVTGHAHAIRAEECDVYLEGTRRFLEVCLKAELRHEEHETIALPKGDYEVRRQYTWSVLEQMQQVVVD